MRWRQLAAGAGLALAIFHTREVRAQETETTESVIDAAREELLPRFHLELGLGYVIRRDRQSGGHSAIDSSGGTPAHAYVKSGLFGRRRHVGAWFSVAAERLALFDRQDETSVIRSHAIDSTAALALRATPVGPLGAQFLLGYAFHRFSLVDADDSGLAARPAFLHGPRVGMMASARLASWLTFEADAHATPLALAASAELEAKRARQVQAGAAVKVGNWRVLGARSALAFGYGFATTTALRTDERITQRRHLLAIGIRSEPAPIRTVSLANARAATTEVSPPEPPAEPSAASTGSEAAVPTVAKGAVRGILWGRTALVGAVRAPLPDGRVAAPDGKVAVADAEGRFLLEGLAAGPILLQVEMPGFSPVARTVEIPSGGEATVDLTLDAADHLSRAFIGGVVLSDRGKPIQAQIQIDEISLRVRPDKDGRFAFWVPPGRYTFTVRAGGHLQQKKIVDVTGGEQSIYNINLQARRR